MEYRPAIDGLRALAVLSVLIFHLNGTWLSGGFVGVDVFFVISGYLITSVIFKECVQGSFSLARFYQRRIARIFPTLFAVGLATIVGAYFIYSPIDLASAGANLIAASLSAANMKLLFQGDYFRISKDAQPFLHYWSLSVEEQFYLIFPALVLVLFKYARKYLVPAIGILCAGSFLASVAVTHNRPVWAFYLLPTRAWELLAGSLLAMAGTGPKFSAQTRLPRWFSFFSLGIIVLSFGLIREGPGFPGFWALLPVIGAVGLLMPAAGSGGSSEKWLAFAPLVLVGRMSYSLYLWHWPIFSMVDYRMYFSPELTRSVLKIGLSFLAAALSFRFIETPARAFFNRRKNILPAYFFMIGAVALSVLLGIGFRKVNYLNSSPGDVAKGGMVFESRIKTGSVVLMGDSHGSMYGATIKEICSDLGYRLTVISVGGQDPLPQSDVPDGGRFWADSLAVVRKEKPDYLILSCNWINKLKDDKSKLSRAVEALKPYVGRLIILNQPPCLPENANRASIRLGARPPFYEVPAVRERRTEVNDYLAGFNDKNCSVIDIASHFETANGKILFLDGRGREIYHDMEHLSQFGVDLIRPNLKQAVLPRAELKTD